MKNILSFLAIFFLLPHISWSQNNVTFQLDMSTVDPTTFTVPEVNGSFNSWCGNCAAMTDPDGDNVWEITVDLANGSYEFKYSADNWSIQESLLPGSFCTNTTGQYTNRVLNVSGDTTLPVVCWESCSNCSAGPSSYDVTFEVDMRNVSQPFTTPEVNGDFNGWCGNCWQMSDADGDSVWQFQMLFAPGDSIEWKYSADNWSIQEDLDSSLSCITINYDPGAPNGWGFVNRVAVINSDTTFSTAWNSCDGPLSIISGCTDPLASNYNPLATVDDGSCLYSITFNVDMNCEDPTSFGFVHLESPYFGWCGGCVPMADPDGDGIHSVTVDLALGNFEYKYAVDNFAGQEDLVDDMLNGATCAPITDYFSYANRQVAINPGVTTSDTYGSCSPCLIGCTDSTALNYNPLATVDDSSCAYCYFGCMDSLACNFDPLATCDDGSCLSIYGCMNPLALNYDSLANCPDSCIFTLGVPGCTDSTALNYNPLATIDDSSCTYCYFGCMDSLACNFNPLATCDDGSCLNIYGCTDTLACNYDPLATCDDGSCLSIYGCTDSTATNYNPLANCEDSSCVYGFYVTFQLDMRGINTFNYSIPEVNGMFNGWCGNCNPLEDLNGDSIWQTTILLDSGTYEYKYSTDNFTVEENLFSGDSCTVSNFGFTNRLLVVDRDSVLEPVCWELCEDCFSGPSSYSVTFKLDMSGYVGPPYTAPEVNGTFNNWCGSCWAMEDADGNNIWEFTALIGAGDSIQFKYSADNWNIQENLDSSLSCVSVSFDPSAPNGWGYVNRLEVVNSEMILDAVCWEQCSGCQSKNTVENQKINSILFYPNPSDGYIKISSAENILKVDVYNTLGKLVFSKTNTQESKTDNFSLEKSGLYHIRVQTKNGVITETVTIQK